MNYTNDFEAFILTGGHSKRFGENKALYIWRGRPLIQYVIDSAKEVMDSVRIISKDMSPYRQFELPVIQDVYPAQNPLVGLLTALQTAETQWVFLIGCDMPFITSNVIRAIFKTAQTAGPGVEVVIPEAAGRRQPLCACYKTSLEGRLNSFPIKNASISDFLGDLSINVIQFDEDSVFRNINRKSDLPR